MKLQAVCAPGLEGVLEAELEALGLRAEHEAPGLLAFEGELLDGARAALFLRCATTVRGVLIDREVRAQGAIDAALGEAKLLSHLPPEAPLSPHVSLRRSWLRHSGVLDEKLRAALPGRRFVPGEAGAVGVLLRLEGRRLVLAVDLAGEPLHRRGWRREGGRAPLRETLACGVLALAGWAPGTPLFDPMCGAGTLVIEAARAAAGIAPGAGRALAIEAAPIFAGDLEPFGRLREAATQARAPEQAQQAFFASDAHRGAVASTRRNAARAGVADHLRVAHARLPAIASEISAAIDAAAGPKLGDAAGLVVCNAPYGRRVGGEKDEVLAAHRALGEAMRGPLAGWRLALLTRDRDLAQATGLALEQVAALKNGGLSVGLFLGPGGQGPVRE